MDCLPVGHWNLRWHTTRNHVTQQWNGCQRDEQREYGQEQDPGENLTSITINMAVSTRYKEECDAVHYIEQCHSINSNICNEVPMEQCVGEPQEMIMM